MSITHKAVGGLAWTSAGRLVAQIVNFATTIILARLLVPEDFGLLGMVVIVTSFTQLLGEMGASAALIQRGEVNEAHRSSMFWLNLGLGLLSALVVLTAAPYLASFYGEPRVDDLLQVAAALFLITPLGTVQLAVLARDMDFRSLAAVEIGRIMVGGIVGLTFAFTGWGVWSLLARLLGESAGQVSMAWLLAPWRPKRIFRPAALRDLLGFGVRLAASNIINFWVRNVDDLLIGRIFGAGPLGYYSRAYGTMLLPLAQITGIFTSVMFPVMSRLQDDREATRRFYTSALEMIGTIAFPALLGLLAVTEAFVVTLYGEDWRPMIPILRVFCVVGAVQSIATTVGWIFQSQGRTDSQLRWNIGAAPVLLGAILAGIAMGSAFHVALFYGIASVTLTPISFLMAGRLIGLRLRDIVRAAWKPFAAATLMAVAVWGLGELWDPVASWAWAKVLVQIASGIVFYGLMLVLLRVESVGRVMTLLRSRLADRPMGSGANH